MKNSLAAVLFFAAVTSSSPAFAGPAVTTEWIEERIALEDCRTKVAAAMRAAGVGSIEPKRFTVFGHKGDYTAAIRCMPDQNVVFFIVSGDQLKNSDDLLDDILAAYRKR